MDKYTLNFDLSAYGKLDEFALLACQSYNLGNDTDWFGTFRGGLYGFYSRIHGVEIHYQLVHSWIPRPRLSVETEYHIASVLFNMDSAIECLVYALNALGFSVMPDGFRNVTNRKELSRVSPRDILGLPSELSPKLPQEGYAKLFGNTQTAWIASYELISTIFELHDVSKHREVVYVGGTARTDPPHGFFEQLGVAGDLNKQALFWPSAEIILRPDPKAPFSDRSPREIHEYPTLESLGAQFSKLIRNSGRLLVNDAMANIELKHKQFR